MLASEMAPLAKVGGLADVVGALSASLARRGLDVRVVLPRYASIQETGHRPSPREGIPSLRVSTAGADVPVHLVDSPRHFGRPGVYADPAGGAAYPDNPARFIHFQQASLGLLKTLGFQADVLHCHDHQTGLVPAYLKTKLARDPFFAGAATVFTVHNLAYQGLYPPETMEAAGFERSLLYPMSPFEFWGQVNFMKAGLVFSDLITTVSPTYAKEICAAEHGCGLEGVLQSRRADLHGVLNGIDDTSWNPSLDPHLESRFGPSDLKGKVDCKAALMKRMGLAVARKRVPVIGLISRLTEQKGLDLLEPLLPSLMERELRLVALGAGEERYVKLLQEAQARWPGRVAVRIGFDEALAHQIEAGADMFLMPSRFEPCGLNQMYSLAYGTVPIVRATGGLADTVREQGGEANGFVFLDYQPAALLAAVDRALAAYKDRRRWEKLMKAGMKDDHSWTHAAGTYESLYERARAGRRGAAERAALPA